jgi:NAD(P)-dependent dehydrogenase (short-subunit alcohol dehydrogenase family)
MQNILVTGANRGIGLEFARQYLARGERVFAAARQPQQADDLRALEPQYPEQLAVIALDVADQASVDAARREVARRTDRLDVLINNAGIYLRGDRPGSLSREGFRETFEVNTIGPAMVVQAFLDLLRKAGQARVLNMSSRMGSIASAGGGAYSYRASKAALNMLTRVLANDLRAMGIIVIAMNPGWVQTDMGGPGAPERVGESVAGMVSVLDRLSLSDSGRFLAWDGSAMAW